MKQLITKLWSKLMGHPMSNRRVINVDSLVLENLALMKEIRMNRIRFYKFYNKAQRGV